MSLLIYAFASDYEKIERIGLPTTTRVDLRAADHAKDVVVRWGKSMLARDGAGKRVEFLHVLNPHHAIRRNVNKPKALARLAEVVKTPRMWTKRMPLRKLAVIRPLFHSQGSGFRVVKGPCRIPKGHYATEYMDTKVEFRSWFVRTGVNTGYTMCARRVPMQKDVVGVHPCRSEWGYQWVEKVPKALHELTVKAATKAGLDVGAVDVLRVKNQWVCLEVNSCPAVDARSIREFFTQYLPMAARAKYPLLQWQMPAGAVPPVLRRYGAPPAAPLWGAEVATPAVAHPAPVAVKSKRKAKAAG